jgi:hypothetical protein
LRTTRRLNYRCNCLFFAIYCCCEVYRDINYSAAAERLAADEKSKFSTHDVDRSDTDKMSRRRRQEATPTKRPSSRPLTSIRSKDKYFPALYARVFSTRAANERLAADVKSKGFWAPKADEPFDRGRKSRRCTTSP